MSELTAGALPEDDFPEDGSYREDFLARLRRREHAAFRELVGHYHKRLLAMAGAVAGPQWAEEVVQEAWVSIYQALPGFEGRSSLRTWIYTIVRNAARNRLRKEARMVNVPLTESGEMGLEEWLEQRFTENGAWRQPLHDWGASSPDAMLQEEELQHCIEHALQQLKSGQKAVFIMRDLEQASLEEICNMLGLSHSNVRVLLHRARQCLLQVIERYQETGEC